MIYNFHTHTYRCHHATGAEEEYIQKAIAGEEKFPVVIGFDAHAAESAFDQASLEKAKQMIEKFNLNYIGMPNLIPIQK